MRRMKPSRIIVFMLLAAAAAGLALLTTGLLTVRLPFGDFRAIVMSVFAVVAFYAFAILIFRLFQSMFPLPSGEIAQGSRAEAVYHVYLLFYLLLFNPIMYSGLLPVPLMRLFYKGLGARMGPNSFSVGIILDPQFVQIGRDSLVGNGALLIPHVIEGARLAHYPIRIGNNVTVGAHSVVLADVEIGDDAIVAVNAVVTKGSRIPAGETWGGIPARRIDK
jgi:hypothetical protein